VDDKPTSVVDTNVLLNLSTPVVDGSPAAPTGADPLKALLTSYDVHVPASVVGELSTATGSGDRLSAAADLVLNASHHLTTHDVEAKIEDPLNYGLDQGESDGIWLANDLGAALFITDEFNSTNYLFVSLALDNRNTLFTTPHVLCKLSTRDILSPKYVDAALSYYADVKQWDKQYLDQLRHKYLRD
jgi:hypothetical protein